MTATRAASSPERTIPLLDYDPALAASLRPERRAEARTAARASLVEVGRGERAAGELTGSRDVLYGVLMLDGLAKRMLVLGDVASSQLLGAGDLVRVIDDDAAKALVPTTTHWTVIEPLTLALLDERFLLTIRRWPELVAALFERLAAQEQRREIHHALLQLPRVEDRLHALMWLLAERWGHVTSQGVVLRLRLTHELLGQLVGAKRPTVSLALKELESRDTVRRQADGAWLLQQAWTPQPSADPRGADDGVGVVPDRPAPDEVLARIERLRRMHERARPMVADTLARSTDAHAGVGAPRPIRKR